jgi:hypothetical protein
VGGFYYGLLCGQMFIFVFFQYVISCKYDWEKLSKSIKVSLEKETRKLSISSSTLKTENIQT